MSHRMTLRCVLFGLAAAVVLSACSARKTYPEPNLGWHSADFSVLFGRLQRYSPPATEPDAPPPAALWTLKFGDALHPYGGEVALTPPERLLGYSGGERVEIRGHLLAQTTADAYNGRWYVVDTIRMWHENR